MSSKYPPAFPYTQIVQTYVCTIKLNLFIQLFIINDTLKLEAYVTITYPPLGIILCSSKKSEQIELLALHNQDIHIAEYMTILPAKEILLQGLYLAVKKVKQRFQASA